MGYKHRILNASKIKAEIDGPNFLIKIIPHVDGRARVCELVEYWLEDIELRGAWAGPGSLQLVPHALAPVAELPVLEVISAVHFIADLTLGLWQDRA
jgi:acetoacetate decarboxylase